MAETPAYLKSKAAKYALGVHRGPLPQEDLDPDAASEHLEETKTITLERTPTTATQTVIKHWKRFWCCYCFANVIFLAIFLPILFCVIIPVIAQRVVDDSSLKLDYAKIMEPRADSVLMSLTSTISLPIALPVRINAFALDLMVRSMPGNDTYAKAYIPETTIKETAQVGETKHPTPLNLPVWKQYVHNVMFQETVPLSVHGSTMQHLGALHSMITMDKDVPLKGLDSFKGFAIKDTTLLIPARDDGSNLIANATLPNPSPFTLEIGTTVFDVKSGDLVLGNATLDHLILERGNGTYPLHGILDLKKMIDNLSQVLQTQKQAIRNGYLELTTVGKSVTFEGKTVDYYQEPLKSLVLPAKVPIGKLLINTLHGLLNEDGKNILSGNSGGSPDLSSLIDKLGDNGGLLNSLSNSGGGGGGNSGGLLSSLKDSSKNLNSRGLDDVLDKPEELFAEALTRLA